MNNKKPNRIEYDSHDDTIISILFGGLLGDLYAQKRYNSTYIKFNQSIIHKEYIEHLHSIFSNKGLCNNSPLIPKNRTLKKSPDKIYQDISFSTYSYESFNWIYDSFYVNKIKQVPKNIETYLNPLALAVWLQDDGNKTYNTIRFCTNSYTLEEVNFLIDILYKKYNINSNPQKTSTKDQYVLYIKTESVSILKDLVRPYIVPSMLYKLGEGEFPKK